MNIQRASTALVLCVLTLSWLPAALAAAISARVAPSSVSVDESFHLILEADRDIDADPDLSALQADFEVINQSRRRDVSVGLGTATVRTSWQIELMPRQAGAFTIPALRIGSVPSNPVTLEVRPARPPGSDRMSHFMVEVDVDRDTVHVQQQVVYSVRVLRNVNATATRLSEPAPEGVATLIERLNLGEEAVYTEVHAGRRYRITENRYAIFPQSSGTLRIPPLQFQAKVIERGGADPALRHRVGTRIIRLRSEAIEIPVSQPPADAPAIWLPARSLRLSDTWSSGGSVAVGDTVTRRIAIEAAGLTAAQLPELTLELPAGIKQYPRQPELMTLSESNGVTGRRVQTVELVATRPGTYTLPQVTLTWWNIETRRTERAALPPRAIAVAAPTAQPGVDPLADPTTAADASIALWPWLSGGLALAWLLTLWRWRLDRLRSSAREPGPQQPLSPNAQQALGAVRQACANHDARAARDALLVWSAALWPQAPPANLTQLGKRGGDALAVAIEDLQRTLYAGQPAHWEGTRLWEQVKRVDARPPTAPARDGALEPLYKTRGEEPRSV